MRTLFTLLTLSAFVVGCSQPKTDVSSKSQKNTKKTSPQKGKAQNKAIESKKQGKAKSAKKSDATKSEKISITPPSPRDKRLAVGDKAPNFELAGHDGKRYSLSGLLKQGSVALVFYRSAKW